MIFCHRETTMMGYQSDNQPKLFYQIRWHPGRSKEISVFPLTFLIMDVPRFFVVTIIFLIEDDRIIPVDIGSHDQVY
jgi:hypothetical protein